MSKRIHHLQRYRTITTALARSGLGFLVNDIGWREKLPFAHHREGALPTSARLGERIRHLLEELGPTFVKLGQIASTRPDLIPPDILTELAGLQDAVSAFPTETVERIIEQELGEPVGQLFRSFEEEPLAAASIGQVHRAVLHDGTQVVVKVQRPAIADLIDTDLDILDNWARVAETHLEWARNYRIRNIIEELGQALRMELDYREEARNTERFHQMSASFSHVHVPQVHGSYCSRRVLTTSFVSGIKFSEKDKLDAAGLDRKKLAEHLATVIFQQILVEGVFHADPHPGNVLALPGSEIALLDFGMIGRLAPGMKKHFSTLIISLRNRSTKGIIRAITNMGAVPEELDRDGLFADVDQLRERYYEVPLSQVSIGQAVQELFAIALRHKIMIPTELTLIGKSLLTMEGVVTALDPEISIVDLAEPFGKKLLLDRFNPRSAARSWLEEWPEYLDWITDMPAALRQMTTWARQGKVKIEATSPQLEQLMHKLDRISNRLSFSVVLLSLSIVMTGLIIGSALRDSRTMLWQVPVIETGFVVVTIVFLWLIYAIFRSGRF